MDTFDFVEKYDFDASPSWLLNASASEVAIYRVAKARFDEIAGYLNSGRILPKRQRQLIRTKLSVCAGLNDKYIHKYKTPKLHEWIDQANQVLELISKRSDASFSHLQQTSKMKRDKLLDYVKELEHECRKFRSLSVSTLCRELVDNALTANASENISTVRSLRTDLKESLMREENCEERARKWQEKYNLLLIKYNALLSDVSKTKVLDASADKNSVKIFLVNNEPD